MQLLHMLFYTTLGATSLCYVIVRLCQSYWKRRGILHEKPKFLWGNVKGVGQKQHITIALRDIYERYKGREPFIGYYVLLKPLILILDLDLIHNILTRDAGHFEPCDVKLPGSRLQLVNAEWRAVCRHARTIYNSPRLDKSLEHIMRTTTLCCRALDAQVALSPQAEEVNVYQFAQSLHMDIFAGLAFGQWRGDDLIKFRSVTQQHLANDFNLWRAYACLQLPFLARYFIGSHAEQPFNIDYYERVVSQVLRDRLHQRQTQPPLVTDFLQLLVESMPASNDRTNCLYQHQIAAQAYAYLFLGLETCSGTLAFCLYELALHADVQQRAYEEIMRVGQWENVSQFVYLKQILYEILRKYSPYPIMLRATSKDYEVDDSIFMLQKGNQLIIPIAAIHHDPLLYPEPERFDPERFHSKAIDARHSAAWLPFGLGSYSCYARQIVEQQLITNLAALLQRYEFRPSASTPIPLDYDNKKIVLTPQGGALQLNVRQRAK